MGSYFKYKLIIFSVVLFSGASLLADEFDFEEEDFIEEKKQAGFVFAMAETGSGLGAFMAWPLINDFHLGVTFDVFFLRDSRQLDFYDPYFGVPITLNKENNVYLFDLFVTVKKRFFKQDLDDSFRPFLTAAAGPIYGMNFPEFDRDVNDNPLRDQFRWALGGYIGSGVDIAVGPTNLVSIRAQYLILPFADQLGERSNHSMFELRFEIGKRF